MAAATPSRSVILATILFATLLLAGTVGGSGGMQVDDRPRNSTTSVLVEIWHADEDHGGIKLDAVWDTTYQARSAAEARRAQNGTLNVSWFRGDEELAAFATTYPDAAVRSSWQQVRYQEAGGPHGEITVITGTMLYVHFGEERDRIVLGPQLATNLSDGDRMTVSRFETWKPAEVSTPATRDDYSWDDHEWRIGSDPTPRFVLNESGVPEREELPPDGDVFFLNVHAIVVLLLYALVGVILAVLVLAYVTRKVSWWWKMR